MCVNPQYLSDEGGIHLTSHAFLPTALLKELSATEDQFYSGIGLMYVMTKRIVTRLCPRISQLWSPVLLIIGASRPRADQTLHSLLQGILQQNER